MEGEQEYDLKGKMSTYGSLIIAVTGLAVSALYGESTTDLESLRVLLALWNLLSGLSVYMGTQAYKRFGKKARAFSEALKRQALQGYGPRYNMTIFMIGTPHDL